jgi:NAD(P)-dependent dehydrogenase (short-subunit alcohol dehydrogenase family)
VTFESGTVGPDIRTVVVTGGVGALGTAVAQRFEKERWRVAVLDRVHLDSPDAGSQLLIGDVDLTDPSAAEHAMRSVNERFGRIDCLVNVAGGFRWELVAGGELSTFDVMYSLNLRTAVVASRAVLPYLKDRGAGRIINVGAGAAAARAGAGMAAYTASKAGVHKLTESLADELKDTGVTVNAVLPGVIDTAQNRADMPNADVSRWVPPADIAEVVLFLASRQARSITGALIPVTGRG